MNFQQLRIIRETVRSDFNLTEVANALYTSQSGVSKHIKDLEDELGVELFVRRGKRLLGLTEPGKELAEHRRAHAARHPEHQAHRRAVRQPRHGHLTIATTHTQARYALPQVVDAFKADFPKVHLALHQGSPAEIVAHAARGRGRHRHRHRGAGRGPELVTFPFYDWHHARRSCRTAIRSLQVESR